MADANQQAWSIYEKICVTSADRPFAFRNVEQMHRDLAAWQASNPALSELRQASPEVLIAFLSHSLEWLKAESRDHSSFRVTSTLLDAIVYILKAAPKRFSDEVVLKVLSELRESAVRSALAPILC